MDEIGYDHLSQGGATKERIVSDPSDTAERGNRAILPSAEDDIVQLVDQTVGMGSEVSVLCMDRDGHTPVKCGGTNGFHILMYGDRCARAVKKGEGSDSLQRCGKGNLLQAAAAAEGVFTDLQETVIQTDRLQVDTALKRADLNVAHAGRNDHLGDFTDFLEGPLAYDLNSVRNDYFLFGIAFVDILLQETVLGSETLIRCCRVKPFVLHMRQDGEGRFPFG